MYRLKPPKQTGKVVRLPAPSEEEQADMGMLFGVGEDAFRVTAQIEEVGPAKPGKVLRMPKNRETS